MGRALASVKGLWNKLRGVGHEEPAEDRAIAGRSTGQDEARSERRREILERLNSNDPGVTQVDRQGVGNSEAEREIELERGRGVRAGL